MASPGEIFSGTNGNSVVTFVAYGMIRAHLAGHAETREE
jgi:hypothetical protein